MFRFGVAIALLTLVVQSSAYKTEIDTFRRQHAAEIGGEDGWAALTDLKWIDNGQFTIGRAPSNALVLNAPSSPERLGTLTVTDQKVVLHVAPNVPARVKDKPVQDAELTPNGPSS